MRIVHNYNLCYHVEKNCEFLVQISHKLTAVGSCSHDKESVLAVSILPHAATVLLELFCL